MMKKRSAAAILASVMICGSLLAACGQGTETVTDESSAVSESSVVSEITESSENAEALEGSESSESSEMQVEMAPEYFVEDMDTPLSDGGGTGGGSGGPTAQAGADGSYTGAINIVENKAPGTVVYQKGGSVIDASNASKGYVMVKQSGVSKRLKVQIVMGDKKYNYDLNNAGNYEAFPLQMGNGTYKIRIMQNKEGNTYFELFSAQINVTLDSSYAPFLAPSQYVNYNASSATIKKAFDLCSKSTTDVEKLTVVYNWIINNITYDTQKAATVQSGYLPNVDSILQSKKGICFDYAAVMAAMLRSQGVPTKLVVGTVSAADLNHAWNEVYLEGKGWVTVRMYFEGSAWERMDPTFAASGGSNIEQYIGNGSNYTTLRIY